MDNAKRGSAEAVRAWSGVSNRLRATLGEERFQRWLEPLIPLSLSGTNLKLGVPNRFVLEWLESRYYEKMREAVRTVLGGQAGIELTISGALFRERRTASGLKRGASGAKTEQPGNYRLETFTPGTVNRTAYRVVKELVSGRRLSFNPLLILGESGLGKTHLLRGLVHAYRNTYPDKKTHCCSGEEFSLAFRSSVRQKGKIERFRSHFRSLTLLTIDEFQLFRGKERTQLEFLYTFDALVNRGGRVVIASSQHPGDIDSLENRLRQRLVGGLVVRLRAPDYRTRLSIARRHNKRLKRPLPEDVLAFLAQTFSRNVRELIGALTRLGAYSSLEGRIIQVEEARELLAENLEINPEPDLPERIIRTVCGEYGLSGEDLQGKSRKRSVVQARKYAIFLLRTYADLSLREIGQLVGGRRAPTVRSAVRDMESQLKRGSQASRGLEHFKGLLGLR